MGLGNSLGSGMILAKLPAKESRATSKGKLWQGEWQGKARTPGQAKPSTTRSRSIRHSANRLNPDLGLLRRALDPALKSLEALRASLALQASCVPLPKTVSLDKRPFASSLPAVPMTSLTPSTTCMDVDAAHALSFSQAMLSLETCFLVHATSATFLSVHSGLTLSRKC
jgi:hypothetical protein